MCKVLLVNTVLLVFHVLNADSATIASAAAGTAGTEGVGMSFGALFSIWWKFIMTSLLLAFFLSCISHFAQYYQMTLDQEDSNKLRRRLPNSVRLELASPTSGRLKLPPPTPVTVAAAASKELHRDAPHTAMKTPAVFLFPKTPSVYPKTPKTPAHALRENQLCDNPGTPETVTPDNRKRE